MQESKTIPLTDYPVQPRQFVYVRDDKILRAGAQLLSVTAEIK